MEDYRVANADQFQLRKLLESNIQKYIHYYTYEMLEQIEADEEDPDDISNSEDESEIAHTNSDEQEFLTEENLHGEPDPEDKIEDVFNFDIKLAKKHISTQCFTKALVEQEKIKKYEEDIQRGRGNSEDYKHALQKLISMDKMIAPTFKGGRKFSVVVCSQRAFSSQRGQ